MRLLTCICFFLFAVTSANAQWHEWVSKHFLDNPLVGKVYVPQQNNTIVTSAERQSQQLLDMYERAAQAKYLLLGENHDNPDHHIIQSKILEAVVKAGRKPAVVFEMIPQSLSSEANSYDLKKDPELKDFAKRLAWQNRGWGAWDLYKPIGLAAARNGLKIVAGNLDRQVVRDLYKSEAALSADQRRRYALNEDFPNQLQTSLKEELIGSHCGMIGETALPAMTRIQRAKDGVMADAMISSASSSGSVLIAGNGHVRNDRGVPWVLHKILSQTARSSIADSDLFSIGLVEVQKDKINPTQYGLVNAEGQALYDIVIFTPKADIVDPCAAMREQFKTKKKSSND